MLRVFLISLDYKIYFFFFKIISCINQQQVNFILDMKNMEKKLFSYLQNA
jgi:hypothetical protein